MTIANIIAKIDYQLAVLIQAKQLLTGTSDRVRKAVKAASISSVPSAESKPKRKRNISAEGRARIAEAQRKRWAASRKTK